MVDTFWVTVYKKKPNFCYQFQTGSISSKVTASDEILSCQEPPYGGEDKNYNEEQKLQGAVIGMTFVGTRNGTF